MWRCWPVKSVHAGMAYLGMGASNRSTMETIVLVSRWCKGQVLGWCCLFEAVADDANSIFMPQIPCIPKLQFQKPFHFRISFGFSFKTLMTSGQHMTHCWDKLLEWAWNLPKDWGIICQQEWLADWSESERKCFLGLARIYPQLLKMECSTRKWDAGSFQHIQQIFSFVWLLACLFGFMFVVCCLSCMYYRIDPEWLFCAAV